MVTTFSLLLRSFGLNGFTELIMQREELTDSLASNLFWINVGVGTMFALAFASSGSLLAHFYRNSAVAQVTRGMSLTIGIGCLGYVHTGLLQRAMRFRTTAIINFAGQVFQVIVSIALAMAGWHYWVDAELAGARLRHRLSSEVRAERLFAFCFRLLDWQLGQPPRGLALWRAGAGIL